VPRTICGIISEQLGKRDTVLTTIPKEDGCYMFIVKNLIFSIPADWLYLSEWKERYKVMYAVCQGLFAESFQNNWVNGTLYLPPFQRKTLYFSDPSEENFNEVDRYKILMK
jgi:hypothetical protein